MWLSIRPYVRPYAKPNTLKESGTITLGTSLILDIHAMINWQLYNQGIRWSVSRDHIAGLGLELVYRRAQKPSLR